MATLSHAESRRMYSWWWDSHISPKNSKWLHENLTDMDAKVKAMIKLIEEDADSFARRAEMYYKKRPELMKLVEEFYRAYRALAERYDHATGVIRHAHRTMVEVFPNQVPLVLADDTAASSLDTDPRTPDMSPSISSLFDPDDLPKDAIGLSSSHFKRDGAYSEDSGALTNGKVINKFNDPFGSGEGAKLVGGRVRKGLNFHEENHVSHDPTLFEPDAALKFEKEIQILKEALAKLDAEKEVGLARYQQSLERLSKLESEFSDAQEDSRRLDEQANKAEREAKSLKEAIARLEAENEASIVQHKQCLERIASLEKVISLAEENAKELNDQAHKAENEARILKQELATMESEKHAAVDENKQSLAMISTLQGKLDIAEEDARRLSEQADKAEREVETLRQALAKMTEEKEAAALQHQQCLETISSLEHKLTCAQEEVQRLYGEIDSGVAKLKGAEERCLLLENTNQSLHFELESLVLKMGSQTEELTEKHKELGRLWTCIQEERLRFMEAETAFQTLQHLHSQTQEELRSLASELQDRAQLLRDTEACNRNLQDELLKIKEENKSLNELNLSSAMSIKDLQNDIFSLREAKGKLEEEVELRADQRNALQQEIYCLKEELNELNKKHQHIKQSFERERSERMVLLEKMEMMEKLLEKNSLLEKSLSVLSTELEWARGKINSLEESFQSLLEEKSTLVAEKANLISQLRVTTADLEALSEKNTILENSLSDAHDELQGLKVRSKRLEDSCQLLENEKSDLINEKESLVSQWDITHQSLQVLESRYRELEQKYSTLETERESIQGKVEELRVSLDVEKQEQASSSQISETLLAGMENQILHLQEEGHCKRRELEEELDKSMNYQLEMFVFQKCVQDLEEKNRSLLIECQKLLKSTQLSDQVISELEHENYVKQFEVNSLSNQTSKFKMEVYELLKVFDIDQYHEGGDNIGRDKTSFSCMLSKLENAKNCFTKLQNENQQLAIEMSVLVTVLGQLRLEAKAVEMERNVLDQELKIKDVQYSLLQREANKILEMNKELQVKLRQRDQKEEVLTTEIGNLHGMLLDLQKVCQNLQKENLRVLEEERSLRKECLDLEEKTHTLEGENISIVSEVLSLSTLTLIFKNVVYDRSVELKELGESIDKLHGVNDALEDNVRIMRATLEEVQFENLHLKESLTILEDELRTVTSLRHQLNHGIANGKDLLCQNEIEVSEAVGKLNATEKENSELQKEVENLKREIEEVKMVRDKQELHVLKLSEVNNHLSKENGCLHEANQELKVKLHQLHIREEGLFSEVQKGNKEIHLWENEATINFSELQKFAVLRALLDQKVHELSEACRSLEDGNASKDTQIELLKERMSTLESENGALKAQLVVCVPALISLRDCVSSLENNTCLHAKLQHNQNAGLKDPKLAGHSIVKICKKVSADEKLPDAYSVLQDLQNRIRAIEKAVIERERLAAQENVNANSKLEAAKRQIEELKFKGGSNHKQGPAMSEVENGLLMKDIMLDKISECSPNEIRRRECAEAEMLESWDTADLDGSIGLTVGKGKKIVTASTEKGAELKKRQKSKHHNKDKVTEKELGVDKLEISSTLAQPRQEANKKKILERINSDIQKLTNLQITVQDLRRKVEITEKSKKCIDECDTLKEQLEEAEEFIMKLFNMSAKLLTNIEDKPFSRMEQEERGNIRRRRISEQARRVSEKIGRLQLEVQKIQFILVKLDDENDKERKARVRIPESRRRVLLRDYLYGSIRTSHRRKKAACCGCIQPSTRGD